MDAPDIRASQFVSLRWQPSGRVGAIEPGSRRGHPCARIGQSRRNHHRNCLSNSEADQHPHLHADPVSHALANPHPDADTNGHPYADSHSGPNEYAYAYADPHAAAPSGD